MATHTSDGPPYYYFSTMIPLTLPSFEKFSRMDLNGRLRLVTQFLAKEGTGVKWSVHFIYFFKIFLNIFLFFMVEDLTHDRLLTSDSSIHPLVFQKLIVFNIFYEVLGLGAGAFLLNGHLVPLVTACTHFLTPGTIKLPPIYIAPLAKQPSMPLFSHTRGVLDVVLYVLFLLTLINALCTSDLTRDTLDPLQHVLPILLLAAANFLSDRTLILAAKAETYVALLFCCLFPDFYTGCKLVFIAVSAWSAVGKLSTSFSYMVPLLASTNPLAMWVPQAVRLRVYAAHPHDLNPSGRARAAALGLALAELAAPALLAWAPTSGWGFLLFEIIHLLPAIQLQFPYGPNPEWHAFWMMIAFHLFRQHGPLLTSQFTLVHEAEITTVLGDLHPMYIGLLGLLLVLPGLGILFPGHVSSQVAMRYYSGNSPASLWVMRRPAAAKLQAQFKCSSAVLPLQLPQLYSREETELFTWTMLALRLLHCHGRVLAQCLKQVLADATDGGALNDYVILDGELVAASLLGHSAGDGQLADAKLLQIVQDKCRFEQGTLVHIQVDAPSPWTGRFTYRIMDAAKFGEGGQGEVGTMDLKTLKTKQPF